MPINVIDIKETLYQTENFYEVIAAVAKRAKQINEDTHAQIEEKLAPFKAKLKEHGLEYDIDRVYPGQVVIAMKYESMKKPSIEALEEYEDRKYEFYYEDKIENEDG